jgi:hypothetical protein
MLQNVEGALYVHATKTWRAHSTCMLQNVEGALYLHVTKCGGCTLPACYKTWRVHSTCMHATKRGGQTLPSYYDLTYLVDELQGGRKIVLLNKIGRLEKQLI